MGNLITDPEVLVQDLKKMSNFDLLKLLDGEELRETSDELHKVDESPVDINAFLDEGKYLGNYFDGQFLSDRNNYWRMFLNEIYRDVYHSPYWLCAMKGAIGVGKTTTACAGMAYDAYRLLCLGDPQRTLGVIPTDKIEFAIFNITLTLAINVVWDKISQMFTSSEYFTTLLGTSRRKHREDSLFPKRIDFYSGSRVSHSLGHSVYEVVMDEANFEVLSGQVRNNFYSLIRRMETRYMTLGGGFPGKIWIISSETDKSSVLNQIIEEYRGKKGVIVRQPSLWEAKPEKYNKNRKRFKVFRGTDLRSPVIIDATNEKEYKNEEENIILVPEEHRDSFESAIHESLRDLAGISTGTSYKLFRMKEKLNTAMCVDLLFPEVFELDFHDDTDQISNKVLLPQYFKRIFSPEFPRYIHIDIGLTGDRLGLACSYVSQYRERTKISITDLKKITEMVPELVTEFAFGIQSKGGHPIPLFKVRAFILWLSGLGYTFGMISSDGYESADFLMMMHKLGFATEELSVDKTSLPYLKLRTNVYEELVYLPASKLLRKELDNLESTPDGSKVDHPEKFPDGTRGSKDIADGVCLAGDTKIILLNGTCRTIKEICESNEEVWVYSCDEKGNLFSGKVINKKYNGVREIVRVHLDNNQFIDCTTDHKFMMRDGSYKEAQCLIPQDSLMPLYRKLSDGKSEGRKLIGYELVFDNYLNKWIYTHYMSSPLKLHVKKFQNNGKWITKPVLHHKNFNKRNNNPINLEWMSWQRHMEIHTSEHGKHISDLWKQGRYKNRPSPSEKARKIASINLAKWNSSPEKIAKFKENGNFSKATKLATIEQQRLWREDKEWRDKQVERMHVIQSKFVEEGRHNFKNDPRNSWGWVGPEPNEKYAEELRKKRREWNKNFLNTLIRTCFYCSKNFTPTIYVQRCCSERCSFLWWKKNNSEKVEEIRLRRNKQSGEKIRKRLEIPKFCAYCGKEFRSIYRNKKFCSKICNINSWKENNPEKVKEQWMRRNKKQKDKRIALQNHKVKFVEFLKIQKDVYDISVEKFHNFAIESGIFVHNCGSQASALRNSDKYKMVYFHPAERGAVGGQMRDMFWPGGKDTGTVL